MSVLNDPAESQFFTDFVLPDDTAELGRRVVASDFVSLIAQRCRRQPGSCAVIASDRRLTYRELSVRVTTLAHRLSQSGVTADSLVGICMPRGADELTAMLAVLTLGAAYVPLDPAQPSARLGMIVADAAPEVVLTKRGPRALADDHSVRTMVIDDDAEDDADDDDDDDGESFDAAGETWWSPGGGPDSLAYVLYTSGSTGRPKGVEIPRSAVSNFLRSMVRAPGLRKSDVLLAVSTTMFDIAVLELLGPLCVGGTVRIVDSDVIKDGRRLRAVLESEPISVMQATPTMWHMLVDAGWIGNGRLRMLTGGEALSSDLARQLLRRGELWNMYGPTETTVWSACRRIEDPDDITIGWPIDNTQLYVLDEDRRLVASGGIGELSIGGAGLARGYLGRPELTARQFICNPYGVEGSLMYRTGDLVRLRDDGQCEYRGRVDQQVKIRGYRVELGEIEHALGEIEGVGRAVVTKWEQFVGMPSLVAYVVPSPGSVFDPAELSRLLRDRLPTYMVPGRYIEMSEFPLTPNRKIDRGGLPDPAGVGDIWDQRPRVGPSTDTERTLAAIWSEVLGRRNIAVEDDFFDLGGQSIYAVRICDRIHRALSVDLPVSALLDRRTVKGLSSHIDGLRSGLAKDEWSTVVPIQPNGSRTPIFCVSGIGGNPMTFRELADSLGTDQPFYGLQYRGVDGIRRPYDSIPAMAQGFADDIRSVRNAGPYVLAGYSGGGLAAYEMARFLVGIGEEVPLLILFDTVRPNLGGWSAGERVHGHWTNTKAAGLRYAARRISDRTARSLDTTRTRIRAGLASFSPYRFRMDAVEMAARRAMEEYEPQQYSGDVLLFQSDPDRGAQHGIPAKQYESNGWTDLVGGRLKRVRVNASHLDIVEGAAGDFVASEISRALSRQTPADGGMRS